MPCGSPSQLRNLALNFESSGWSPGLWCCLSGALPVSDTVLRLLTFHAESCPAPTFLGPVEPSRPLTGPHSGPSPDPVVHGSHEVDSSLLGSGPLLVCSIYPGLPLLLPLAVSALCASGVLAVYTCPHWI